MSTLSQFFAAGGGGGFPVQFTSNDSGTFVTPIAGSYLITAIGGGGGGSRVSNGRGGGAGGLAQSLVALQAGVTLTITVGAGGIDANPTGATGGTTTITGSGLSTLTANGGAGGQSLAGAAGGTASGGNIMNVTGGGSGNVIASGGGAVGVYGTTPPDTVNVGGRSVGPFADINQIGDSFLFSGRILQPSAGIVSRFNGQSQVSHFVPGQAAIFNSVNNAASGFFAGGMTNNGSRPGGRFGGGGGGQSSFSATAGGVGGVVIEYFIA